MKAVRRPANILGKVVVALCLCAAIVYGLLYANAPWLQAQGLRRAYPATSFTPVELATKAEAPLSSASFEFDGFRIPLPGEPMEKPRVSRDIAMVQLRNGELMFRDSSLPGATVESEAAKRVLGPELVGSQFKQMEAILRATPEQVKLWGFRSAENERVEYLLILKSLVMLDFNASDSTLYSRVHSISAGRMRGFEMGDPEAAPYEVRLRLFDETDRPLVVTVVGEKGHGPVLTQAEINAMVAGMRTVGGR